MQIETKFFGVTTYSVEGEGGADFEEKTLELNGKKSVCSVIILRCADDEKLKKQSIF